MPVFVSVVRAVTLAAKATLVLDWFLVLLLVLLEFVCVNDGERALLRLADRTVGNADNLRILDDGEGEAREVRTVNFKQVVNCALKGFLRFNVEVVNGANYRRIDEVVVTDVANDLDGHGGVVFDRAVVHV